MKQVVALFGHCWRCWARLGEERVGGVPGSVFCSSRRAATFASNPLNSATNFEQFEQYYFQPHSHFRVRVEDLKIFAQDFSRFMRLMTSPIHYAPLIFAFALTALTDCVCYEAVTEAITREIEGQIYTQSYSFSFLLVCCLLLKLQPERKMSRMRLSSSKTLMFNLTVPLIFIHVGDVGCVNGEGGYCKPIELR